MANPSKKKDPDTQAPEMALRLLARREHSRFELTMKLRQRQVSPGVIETVLDECEEKGWLSDDRFAEVFVRQRVDAGYGPLKILADLQQRGISRAPPELAGITEGRWVTTAIHLRDKRFGLGNVSDDWNECQRQGGFLIRRGFTADQVKQALEALTASEE